MKKSEVIAKLNTLKENSPTQDFFDNVYLLVDNYYFSLSGCKNSFDNFCVMMMNELKRRNTIYEREIIYPTDYPDGFFDYRICFFQFDEIMNISVEEFNSGWKSEETSEGEITYTGNTYLEKWEEEITEWCEIKDSKLNSIAGWCEHNGGGFYLTAIFEDLGKVISAKSIQEIADIMYKDRYFKECIDDYCDGAFVPSYER